MFIDKIPADLETKSDDTGIEEVKGALAGLTDDVKARLDAMEAQIARPNLNKGSKDETTDEQKAFAEYLHRGDAAPEVKTLTVSSDPGAGYLAPVEMNAEFIRNLVEFSPIRQYASVRTTSAPAVRYPKRNSITNSQWEGELEESQASEPTFGQLEIPVHKLTTFVDISEELLADSGGSAEQEVRLALAEDFGQKEAIGFVSGSGVKQPEGFMSNADIAATVNGHATNLSADKLIDLLYSLPASYRNASGAAWAMNGTTLAAVRKLKDGQNNFLWQPSYQAGQPETLLGKPVVEMVDMPDIADGAFPVIYGDWSSYRILDRLNLSVLVDPYTQKRNGVVRIHGTRRVGGRILQAARFRKLKTATS
ncbi:phage major capsid protein [Bosea sp. FBZP-16]|uniref:phage major capsid protein n=1 Tax=Bosea sp. FBZP-16 TaxID=2065382 RepID=UPI000C31885D|nr:phage major capsid protein [Bosea sp. FBZP-16]